MNNRTEVQTLIAILEEWIVTHTGKVNELNDPESRYSVIDFMNATSALFALKGTKTETFEIRGGSST